MALILSAAFLAIFPTCVFAEGIGISMKAGSAHVRPGAPFELEISVEADGIKSLPEPTLPQLAGLEITGKAVSQQVKIVNFSAMISKTITYTARIQKEGVHTIPPVTVEHGGKKYSSEPVTITVDQSAPAPTGRASAGRDPLDMGRFMNKGFFPGRGKDLEKDDLFVTMDVDKNETVPYEQIIATFSFYRAVELWEQPNYVKPDFKGFWVEELAYSPTRKEFVEKITIKDKTYNVSRLKYALIPMTPGNVAIDPARIYVSPDPWSDRINLSTQPVSVDTKPFPEKGKPPAFSGMTGRYDVVSSVDSVTAPVNGGMTLKITITGDGYLKASMAPPKPDIPGFEVFDPKITDTMDKTQNGLKSTRVIEYPLIPKEAGEKIIPSMAVVWFDPVKKEYVEKKTPDVKVTITPVAGQGATITARRGEITQSGSGIRFIKPDSATLEDYGTPLYRKKWALTLFIPPLLAVIMAFVAAKRRERLANDPAYARLLNAAKNARLKLAEAEKTEDPREFYSILDQALRGYLADRWDIPAPSVTQEVARERLGGNNGALEKVIGLMDRLEAARYSPIVSPEGRMESLAQAGDVIAIMERMK
ncbi:MAG: protein BatD [Nitrospinae bacterium]|nr:protein BatD [Nitrospinota bacterium]MBF0635011.1 protein BatD [Nitrospinota bacterium]